MYLKPAHNENVDYGKFLKSMEDIYSLLEKFQKLNTSSSTSVGNLQLKRRALFE